MKNSLYDWRIIPSEELCTVFAVPSPPATVRNVTVQNFHSLSSRLLMFDVNWLPNEDVVSSYEIVITESEMLDLTGSDSTYKLVLEVSTVGTFVLISNPKLVSSLMIRRVKH